MGPEASNQPRWRVFLEEELFVVVAALFAALFVATGFVPLREIPRLVDWNLLEVLFALLIAVELVRESALLERAVVATVSRFRSARTFTFALVMATGVLAMLVTNDVALFVVIPFTVLAKRYSDFEVRSAVVLEVISANVIGCLTPLGNPQNLFIHHVAGTTPGEFVSIMLPLVVWGAIGLALFIRLLEPSRTIETAPQEVPPIDRLRAVAGVVCFVLVVLEIFRVIPAWPAATAAAIATLAFLTHRYRDMDLSIVPLFFFAFIVVEGLRAIDAYAAFEDLTREPSGLGLFVASAAASQVISNVPAAILLSPAAQGRWTALLYGVNAGGCGTIIASLANLLGWQIFVREHGKDPAFFRRLSWVNVVFLVWLLGGGAVILRLA